MRSAVKDVLAERSWDVVVVDHLQMAWVIPLLDDLGSDVRPDVVFVTHNHESSVRGEIARSHRLISPRGAALRLDALKAGRLERRTVAACDLVTSITASDQQRFEADAPNARHLLVEPGYTDPRVSPDRTAAGTPRRVVIVGSFEWHAKADNLRRFVDAADPLFADAGIELVVAGTLQEGFEATLASTPSATRFAGWVDDLDAFLADARIGLVPETLGGGFKLKSLDYVFHRVPMAVISGSVAGLPLRGGSSMLEADSEIGLARLVIDAIDEISWLDRLSDQAYQACHRTFGWDERGRRLSEAIVEC
jgi:glycosyltransferase involved in cell wall biosynthesis